ncbi:GNAT family N-acetyltransferase [Sphingomonas spermidinifaciens]|uniref:GNAT family N-acetyltransferase n=1 Tax=Sphingomonas spermidinifaciens TaxID=1141889 RepID=A0A2A4B761_9SPHN|nr:GNAT family N-acetyltransferase [Sphingomonas spermidinifaciens]PCD04301.1 GNAT family N-acetyltransferase [Sphingomonas spermidinifaciens]
MTVELRSGDVDAFFAAPFNAYAPDVGYVSPLKGDVRRMLDARANPLWTAGNPFAFWTAHRAGRPVGRIIAHVHRQSNSAHGTARAQFGFFDCADDADAAAVLLGAAERFAREQGQADLVGNFNLTAMQQCGVMTGGYGARAYTDMVVNAAHVPRLLEANGFARFFPMRTFELDLAAARTEGLRTLEPGEGFSFAPVAKASFAERMEEARIVLNDGFADNPMFVPLTAAEFRFQAGEMMSILDPRLSSVLLKDGQPVGTVICIPDLNGLLAATGSRIGLTTPFHYLRYRLGRQRAVIIFYSVARAMHGQGVMGGMLARTVTSLRDAGYRQLGITWIADVNAASLRQMEKLGARPLHHLHLFRKELA